MRYVYFLVLWLSLAGGAHAQPAPQVALALPHTLLLTADTQSISSRGALSLLTTDSASAEADAVEADPTRLAGAATWRTLPGNINLGFSDDAIWLKLTVVRDAGAPEAWVLNFDNALLDDVRVLYRAMGSSAASDWTQLHAGEDVPRGAWPLDARNPSFPLRLPAGETTLLMRLQSKNTLAATATLWQRDAFDNQSRRDVLYHGLYFGACLLLMLLHGVLWCLTKERQNGWYLLYLTAVSLVQMLVKGMPQWMFRLPVALSDPLLVVCLCLSLLVSARISIQLLELAATWPRGCRRLTRSIALVCGLCMALLLAGDYAASISLIQYANLVYLAAMVGVGIFLLRRGHSLALFFVFSFGVYIAADGFSFMRRLLGIPPNDFTRMIFLLGSLLHMVGISLLLNFQLALLRRRAADAQNQAMRAMFTLNDRLETEVAARTAELSEALASERRIKEEQRSFVAMVSHEFHTPLAIINMTAQQIARNAHAAWSEVEEHCRNLRTTVQRMRGLVDTYLSVDRMDEAPVVALRSCNVRELLDELMHESGGRHWPPGRVSALLDELPEPFVCDPGLLKIALQNLLSNADRHAPPGEAITLHARTEVRALESGVHNGLRVDVRNGGEPIPAEEAPRLFQKYFRGRLAQQRTGAGLGLHLVQRIAGMHGGTAWLENAGQDGPITFSLWISAQGESPRLIKHSVAG